MLANLYRKYKWYTTCILVVSIALKGVITRSLVCLKNGSPTNWELWMKNYSHSDFILPFILKRERKEKKSLWIQQTQLLDVLYT